MTNILITGGTGLLGPYLQAAAGTSGRTIVSGRTSGDFPCDLTDPAATRELIAQTQPDYVFHCAAMTDVDGCESEPARARSLNCDTTRNLAEQLASEVTLTYFSTDQVYPDKPGLHKEADTGPVNK